MDIICPSTMARQLAAASLRRDRNGEFRVVHARNNFRVEPRREFRRCRPVLSPSAPHRIFSSPDAIGVGFFQGQRTVLETNQRHIYARRRTEHVALRRVVWQFHRAPEVVSLVPG